MRTLATDQPGLHGIREASPPGWARAPGRPVAKPRLALAFILALLPVSALAEDGRAEPGAAKTAASADAELFLSVVLNGTPRNLVAHFTQRPDGTLVAEPRELVEVGLAVPMGEAVVPLASLRDVSYSLDSATQTIEIDAPLTALAPKEFDLSLASRLGSSEPEDGGESGYGAVLNYDLYGASSNELHGLTPVYNGSSASLEMRAFSPFGVLRQTGIVGNTTFVEGMSAVRLDTTFTHSDPSSERVFRAFDIVSSGMAWTRPVRLGGVQLEKNFGLRSGLVTLPLPTLSGSAAVPSSLDLYVNGTRTFTQDVPAGPFQLNNVPIITGAGTTRLVLRDASGQEISSEVPYFSSAKLLKPGFYDYSVEAGMPRLDYASESFDYSSDFAVSASGRVGVTDGLTLESHAEGTKDFFNAGGGFDMRTGDFGVLTAAGAASVSDEGTGTLAYASYQFQIGDLSVNLDSQRTFGDYTDLAAETYKGDKRDLGLEDIYFNIGSIKPARKIDRVAASVPVVDWGASLTAAYTHYDDGVRDESHVASLSFSGKLPHRGSVFASVVHDFSGKKGTGIFAGLSFPLDGGINASSSVSKSDDEFRVTSQASKAMSDEPGSLGWSVTDSEGGEEGFRSAQMDYRTSVGTVGGGIAQSSGRYSATAHVRGAVAAVAGGGIHLAPHIDDSFAVVKAGAPGVPVSVENRRIGVTGRNGDLLVTGLRGGGKNQIDIDTTKLPVGAVVDSTGTTANPKFNVGLVIDFGVKASARTARVAFVDAAGKPIDPGAQGLSNGESFTVGYDGQAYLTKITAHNDATIQLANSECHASFDAGASGSGALIGPVVCR